MNSLEYSRASSGSAARSGSAMAALSAEKSSGPWTTRTAPCRHAGMVDDRGRGGESSGGGRAARRLVAWAGTAGPPCLPLTPQGSRGSGKRAGKYPAAPTAVQAQASSWRRGRQLEQARRGRATCIGVRQPSAVCGSLRADASPTCDSSSRSSCEALTNFLAEPMCEAILRRAADTWSSASPSPTGAAPPLGAGSGGGGGGGAASLPASCDCASAAAEAPSSSRSSKSAALGAGGAAAAADTGAAEPAAGRYVSIL